MTVLFEVPQMAFSKSFGFKLMSWIWMKPSQLGRQEHSAFNLKMEISLCFLCKHQSMRFGCLQITQRGISCVNLISGKNEILAYMRKLKPGGVICGDDLNWEPVLKSIVDLWGRDWKVLGKGVWYKKI